MFTVTAFLKGLSRSLLFVFLMGLLSVFLTGNAHADDQIEVEGYIQAIGMNNLTVNGTVFYVDLNTVIQNQNGILITLSDLQVGNYVEVEAVLQQNGTYLATEIELEGEGNGDIEVQGTIQALGPDNLTVNGTVFFVDSATVILDDDENPILFSDLQVGMYVEVKAVLQPDSTYLATKIKVEDEMEQEIEVQGFIQSIGLNSLVVGGSAFLVNASTIILGPNGTIIPFTDLQVGLFVEVEAVLQPDSSLLARKIKVEDDFEHEIEITAPIDTIIGDTVVVGAIAFWTDANTVIKDNNGNIILLSDLQVGMIVEVEGSQMPDGSHYASEIKVEDYYQVEIEVEGVIDQIGSSSLVVLGRTFMVNSTTVILDTMNQPTSFASLSVGQNVELRARHQNDGSWLATRIEIKNSSQTSLEVLGNLQNLESAAVWVSGVRLEVNSQTLVLTPTGMAGSFADLSSGLVVKVNAIRQNNGGYLATRIKIEDSPDYLKMTGVISAVTSGSIQISSSEFVIGTTTVILDENYQPTNSSQLHTGQQVRVWADASGGPQQPQLQQVKINKQNGATTTDRESDLTNLPDRFILRQNYPNPFNPTTTIGFQIPKDGHVTLKVYNALGQEMATLVDRLMSAGEHRVIFDAKALASGVYFYVLKSPTEVQTRKMFLVR